MGYTVLTTMKNEGAFLIEWLAHHKALGFDHVVLCTNDCDDPTAAMAQRLQRMGLVRHHATRYRPGASIQRAAFRQARAYPEIQNAEWVYICDADEFLVVKLGAGRVQDLTAAASAGVEVISVPWRTFGPDGIRAYQDLPVTAQFRRAAPIPAPDQMIGVFPKSLFRGGATLAALERLGTHAPIIKPAAGRGLVRELPGGVEFHPLAQALHIPADYRFAQVNHYVLRARDSFLVKRDRGKVNHVEKDMAFDYYRRNDAGEVLCHEIDRYAAESARWRAELMADRRLATLHSRAVRWHERKIATLKKRRDFKPLIAETEARLIAQGFPPEGKDI